MPNNIDTPVVPEYITVHLGLPDQPAENMRVPFVAYIKNVASSEIYPNWPESAIHANILAQISYAMNRIYTEYYRSRGYDFDITSTTQYDQKFILNRDIFENISQIVDHIFNDYVVKQGTVQPYFTQYCNGTTSTCPGLSQWGTVGLARQGLVPYEILQHFYGDDINIVFNAPVGDNEESYPGVALRLGSIVESVRVLQRELNRIGDNYPAIPRIPQISVYYDLPTENAVRAFQKIFNLTPDGVVGKATWYKIKLIYSGIKQLNELMSEGITPEDAERFYPPELKEGDSGTAVEQMQNLLTIIAYFDNSIPLPAMNGVFDARTKNSLMAFQTGADGRTQPAKREYAAFRLPRHAGDGDGKREIRKSPYLPRAGNPQGTHRRGCGRFAIAHQPRSGTKRIYPAGRGRRDLRRGNGECREGRAGARRVRCERHRRAADVAGFAAA